MSLSPIGGMAEMHVFVSHRRNGGNACLVRLCSPVCVGEGHGLWVISFRAPLVANVYN